MPDFYLGYDPGGGGKHGVAVLQVAGAAAVSASVGVVADAESAFQWMTSRCTRPLAVGIDTLTVLSTGRSGDRPADLRLRTLHPAMANSVMRPNSLYGSMIANGIAVAILLRGVDPGLDVTETHPTVVDYHLNGYGVRSWATSHAVMSADLIQWLGLPSGSVSGNVAASGGHAWAALLSAASAWKGHTGDWTTDLHALPATPGMSIVDPIGGTHYYWPV